MQHSAKDTHIAQSLYRVHPHKRINNTATMKALKCITLGAMHVDNKTYTVSPSVYIRGQMCEFMGKYTQRLSSESNSSLPPTLRGIIGST